MKQTIADVMSAIESSRPLRARGLKQLIATEGEYAAQVAPPAGAWIETLIKSPAWNETLSRPLRARGLKP
ncbi:hypothetical protein, partial [Marinobacter gelidimuriae]|uniref:hypothetical protein n=1 Tax=Marinobacter gelidimuriae TaxID=2739064 RepID=UPI00389919CE